MTQRRYLAGMAGIGLGSALLAVSFLVDRTLLGPFTTLALAGAVLSAVGSLGVVIALLRNPEAVDFEESGLHRQFPTVVYVGGFAVIVAGLLNLALAVAG